MATTGAMDGFSMHDRDSLNAVNDLPLDMQNVVRDQARNAVAWAFISIMPILGASVIAGFFLGNVYIVPSSTAAIQEEPKEDQETVQYSEVVQGMFLLAALQRNINCSKELTKITT